MSSDPLTTMINEADTPGSWAEAATMVRTRVTIGGATASDLHHLMVKGWRVLAEDSRDNRITDQEFANIAGFMTRRMVDVLDTAVRESGV